MKLIYLTLVCVVGCAFSRLTDANQIAITDKFIQSVKKNHGEYPSRRVKAWKKLMHGLKLAGEKEKIKQVNQFFNQFQYESDINYNGLSDYWKTPDEFVISGGGDCEDFSIAKYFTLITLKVPPDKLRITYVKSLTYNRAHMVLAYYPSPKAEPLILDNLSPKVLLASKRKDLKPVYSFNGKGLWVAKKRGQARLIGKPSNLSKWKEVLKRMQQEDGKK